MKIYSVYDSKAEAYLTPFFEHNNATALRAFAEAANKTEHRFNKYAADYTLFAIGEWDETKGNIKPDNAKTSLGTALEYLQQIEKPINMLREVAGEK